MSIQTKTINLTEEEVIIADNVGGARDRFDKKMGIPEKIVQVKRPTVQNTILGYGAELAVAKYLNLFPDLSFIPTDEPFKGYDLIWYGLRVDVKWGDMNYDSFYIPEHAKECDHYIFVTGGPQKYRIMGWMSAEDAKPDKKADNTYWNTNVPKACWVIPKDDLLPIGEFIDVRRKEDE